MNGNRGKTTNKKTKKKSNPILDWFSVGLCTGAVIGISIIGLCGFKSLWIGLVLGGALGALIGYLSKKDS